MILFYSNSSLLSSKKCSTGFYQSDCHHKTIEYHKYTTTTTTTTQPGSTTMVTRTLLFDQDAENFSGAGTPGLVMPVIAIVVVSAAFVWLIAAIVCSTAYKNGRNRGKNRNNLPHGTNDPLRPHHPSTKMIHHHPTKEGFSSSAGSGGCDTGGGGGFSGGGGGGGGDVGGCDAPQ